MYKRQAQRFLLIEHNKLVEVTDPEAFFAGSLNVAPTVSGGKAKAKRRKAASPVPSAELAEDALLERIDFLEQKLAEDEARKAKFQKPKLQKEWREELRTLLAKLD